MNQYDQQYQAPPTSYPPPAADGYKGQYVTAPPPMGYPTKEDGNNQRPGSAETKSRGDGFLKGCLAGLCCCWCLDICF
ncbi:hypothetical protein CDL12_21960 [Handroanthus impetiginosus]|uniref:Cysteine-rich transmembrane domain-containing protein n=1 Tax=Handroanthus impetiginosus TaxID=429701 RepID=A0A2G9GJN3_9LAMI|nr:hypothetical protein CDL12_21960 [Handroanthus impetiginosus]